jgi:hypothetical protein
MILIPQIKNNTVTSFVEAEQRIHFFELKQAFSKRKARMMINKIRKYARLNHYVYYLLGAVMGALIAMGVFK